jgi:Fibronectin type III domain
MNRTITCIAALLMCAMFSCSASAATSSADPPTGVTALAGSSSATVHWVSPATVDGAPVTSFTVTASTGQRMMADEPNHWAIVPGLTDGRPVTFTVTASSSAGTSPVSVTSRPVTPQPVAPPRRVLLGTPKQVSYDHYSVVIGGRRVLLRAGEFDYYRLPSPRRCGSTVWRR